MQTRQRLCGDLSGESESRIDLPSAGPFYRQLQRSWYLLSMTAVFQFGVWPGYTALRNAIRPLRLGVGPKFTTPLRPVLAILVLTP